MEAKQEDNVKVGVRIRPNLDEFDEASSPSVQVLSENPPVIYIGERQQSYAFDNIFTDASTQEDVYKKMVKPLVTEVMSGYNCTVFAYGQTGTGKTYTIGTNPQTYEESGFISRTLDDFFESATLLEDREVIIKISFIEIYNEKVYDLLNNSKNSLTVKAFKIIDVSQVQVQDICEACHFLRVGSKNRHISETKQNGKSSRSHAVFTIHCSVKHSNSHTEAKLNLVDLAGSESVRKTGNQGSTFNEGVNINKGLFNIGRVVYALSTNVTHIPYRQSMITTILQDSLNKTNFVTLLACISPSSVDINETIQTLDFAQQAKKVRNKPEINKVVEQFKKNNPGLFKQQSASAVKPKPTPVKRLNHYSLQCSTAIKQPRTVNLTWTPASIARKLRNASHEECDSPKSLLAMSLSSSVLSIPDLALPSISPIVKKCTEALEATMMVKLQEIVKTHDVKATPQNSPSFSWQKLRLEVSHMIHTEIRALTNRKLRVCSSPIESVTTNVSPNKQQNDTILPVAAKRLDFGQISPNSDSKCLEDNGPINDVFKIPLGRPKKRAQTNSGTLIRKSLRASSSNISPNIARTLHRRSVRLSLKKVAKDTTQNSNSETHSSPEPVAQRPDIDGHRSKPGPTPAPRTHVAKEKAVKNGAHSPRSVHEKKILNILNNGNVRELATLATIGAKTAGKIYLYRQLNGKFEKIENLSKMPSWTQAAYKRFLRENLLDTRD